jgi:hypothetical protein
MATKTKGTIQRIVDAIGDLVRQPMSDESNEAPPRTAVRRSKKVAAGNRIKVAKAKGRKNSAKKRTATKKKR